MRRLCPIVLFAGLLVVATTVAKAEPTAEQNPPTTDAQLDESARREQAKTLFERAIALYRDERYREALNYFIGAQNLFPNATITFNIARTCERLKDNPCALKHYRDYRRTAQSASDLDEVSEHIKTLELDLSKSKIQQVTLFSDPTGATVSVDGVDKGSTPWTGELVPGQHTARLKLPGYADLQLSFLVEAAHAADWTYTMQPAPVTSVPRSDAAQPPEVPERPAVKLTPSNTNTAPAQGKQESHATIRPWTWVALGSGVAALGTAGILESLRASSERGVRERATQLDRVAAYESMNDYQKFARIAVGAGAVLTAIGVTLLVVDMTRPGQERRTVTANCAGTYCQLDVRGLW